MSKGRLLLTQRCLCTSQRVGDKHTLCCAFFLAQSSLHPSGKKPPSDLQQQLARFEQAASKTERLRFPQKQPIPELLLPLLHQEGVQSLKGCFVPFRIGERVEIGSGIQDIIGIKLPGPLEIRNPGCKITRADFEIALDQELMRGHGRKALDDSTGTPDVPSPSQETRISVTAGTNSLSGEALARAKDARPERGSFFKNPNSVALQSVIQQQKYHLKLELFDTRKKDVLNQRRKQPPCRRQITRFQESPQGSDTQTVIQFLHGMAHISSIWQSSVNPTLEMMRN